MYYDLFVKKTKRGHNSGPLRNTDAIGQQLYSGFDVVAVTTNVSASAEASATRDTAPSSMLSIIASSPTVTRVNVIGKENSNLLPLCRALKQDYQLVSVEPQDAKSFQLACTTLPLDIITMNACSSDVIDTVNLKQAIGRNVFLELQVAGVDDPFQVKALKSLVQKIKRSRFPHQRIVLSSGAGHKGSESPGQRTILAEVLGMSRHHSVMALTKNPASCLQQATLRRVA